jgi:hypothetical protein
MYNYFTHEKKQKEKDNLKKEKKRVELYESKRRNLNEELINNYEKRITNFIYDVCCSYNPNIRWQKIQ